MVDSVLNTLLKDNFEHYQVMWNELQFHTHTAHHLGSLALLGASAEQLKDVYENTSRYYSEKYEPSPHEITKDNWRSALGDHRFCSAYRDFFNKELPAQGDWKKKFIELLLDDTNGSPLIDATLCGLVHPIIHIGYAVELDSRSVACEALEMTAVCCDPLYPLTSKLQPPKKGGKKALQVIKDIHSDDHAPTFDTTFQFESGAKHESFLLSYYNEWQMPDSVDKTMEELFDMSVYLYGATHKPDQIDFDFILLHLVTGMNGIRTFRPYLDEVTVKRLLRSFFYTTLFFYIIQQQPKLDEKLVDDYKVEEKKYNWEYVIDRTLHTKLATESHLVKVVRALKDAERDYGSKEGLYLVTAVKTVDNLNTKIQWDNYKSIEPWTGKPGVDRELNVKY